MLMKTFEMYIRCITDVRIIYTLYRLLNAPTTVKLSSIGDIIDRVERIATASFVVDLRGMRIGNAR